MEKYGQPIDSIKAGLLNEEATLMRKVAEYETHGVKTASDQMDYTRVQQRLSEVRASINDLDRKSQMND